MPSVPQSLLWISLVVLWLFVLVPMLISKRDAVRRTSDVALATRVLNSAAGARLLRRTGPAAGHRSDPDWQPQESADLDDDLDDDSVATQPGAQGAAVMAAVESTDSDDEGSGAQPIESAADESEAEPVAEERTAAAEISEAEVDDTVGDEEDDEPDEDAAQYEYVDDTSGIEVAAEPSTVTIPVSARRHRYASKSAAAVSARKFRFRRRMVMTMALSLLASALVAYLVTPTAWWVCGGACVVTVLYLAYLRRQTRIEQRLRRRRMQRVARSRLGVENTYDREFDVVPARLRRPGAVVLEIDDEDPIFEHLDYASLARHYDLPRAAGQ